MLHIKSISRPIEIGLRLTGIWPGSSYENIVRIVWITVLTFAQICQYRYIINHVDVNHLVDLIDSVGTTLPYSLLYVKLIVFWTKRGIFKNILGEMSNDWDNSSTNELNINDMMNKVVLAYRCSKFIMCVFVVTACIYGGVFVEYYRHEVDGESQLKSRELLLKMDFPFPYYKTPIYEWVFVGQFVQLILNGFTIGMMDGLIITLTLNTDRSMKTFAKIILFYFAITMEAFFFSFGGEYLSNKSLSISNAAYSSPWYLLKPQDRRIIILLMIRSQRRLTITAGKFMDLTLEGFANVRLLFQYCVYAVKRNKLTRKP
ncbi:Odorant receptor 45b [Anthophora plagiata]